VCGSDCVGVWSQPSSLHLLQNSGFDAAYRWSLVEVGGHHRGDASKRQIDNSANASSIVPPDKSAATSHLVLPSRRILPTSVVKKQTRAKAPRNTPAQTSGRSRRGCAVSLATEPGTARNQKARVMGLRAVINRPVV